MEISGTREGYSLWKGTSSRELMRAEARAWSFCGRDLDHLESYFVPIEFDQRYPLSNRKDEDCKLTEGNSYSIYLISHLLKVL